MGKTKSRVVLHPDKTKNRIAMAILISMILMSLGSGILYISVAQNHWTAGLVPAGLVLALLDVLIACANRDDNDGMRDLLDGMRLICGVMCVLFVVACVIYSIESYRDGIVAAIICLVFFLIQFGCYMMAFSKLKKMMPYDSQAYKRFRKCRFYAMLLIAVLVVVTVAVIFAPEEEARRVFSVFSGSFLSLMVFTQMADVYMIEVPKEAKN